MSLRVIYDKHGNVSQRLYHVNNKFHRVGGPAIIYYYENGNIKSESFFINGIHYRKDGPQEIQYYVNGNIKKEHYKNKINVDHIESSIIEYYPNGNVFQEFYYLNNEYHNFNGPSYIKYNENGEAYIVKYYLYGKSYSELEYFMKVGVIKGGQNN